MVAFPRPVYARKLFDIGWPDILRATRLSLAPNHLTAGKEENAARALEQIWGAPGAIVTLSVRSAFDLLLQACAYPPGSEIIMSAVTVPHMAEIVRLHNLVVVPVDLQPADASISALDVSALITPKTRAIVFAQLFGARHSLDEISEVADKHKLLLIEDCAQCFRGLGFNGSPGADVSMFSFGPIKTCTALAGGITTVRQAKLLEEMKKIQSNYPRLSQRKLVNKILKYATFKSLVASPVCYGVFISAIRLRTGDHHSTITTMSHSLPKHADLLQQIRQKPSWALIKLLTHRIANFNPSVLQHRTARIVALADQLPSSLRPVCYRKPAKEDDNLDCHFWICPIVVRNPEVTLRTLLDAGFDAAAGDASLIVVSRNDTPTSTSDRLIKPHTAMKMMEKIIYLPVDNQFGEATTSKLVHAVISAEEMESGMVTRSG